MNKLFDFLSSALFSNILAIISLLIAFLPQKDTVNIDNSRNYYFERANKNSSNNQMEFVIGIIGFIFTYLVYSLFQQYFPAILLLLSFALLIRYRVLKISYFHQMIVPAILVVTAQLMNFLLPNVISNYWQLAYKFDINQIDGFSKVFNQLLAPIPEIINLVRNFKIDPTTVSIFSNLIFAFLSVSWLIVDLFQPKHRIRIRGKYSTIGAVVVIAIIVSFMFYSNPNSLARKAVESFHYFFTH